MSNYKSWYGVDLDGTLAHYDHWRGIDHIGAPIPLMLKRVKQWLSEGKEVRIFTARVCGNPDRPRDVEQTLNYIEKWCFTHIGKILKVTAMKDFGMVELWDDRAVQVIPNTGQRADNMRDTCRECGNEIDPDICHCGSAKHFHGMELGHSFVPAGCTCFYIRCKLPPAGWTCNRNAGHSGPCAAYESE